VAGNTSTLQGVPASANARQSDPFGSNFIRGVAGRRYASPSRRPPAEAISKYILVAMYAKAVQGMAPADAVKWAHGELVKIYT
jgi:hypothetical protein